MLLFDEVALRRQEWECCEVPVRIRVLPRLTSYMPDEVDPAAALARWKILSSENASEWRVVRLCRREQDAEGLRCRQRLDT